MRKAYVQMVAFYWSAKTVIFVLGAVPAQRGDTGSELPPPTPQNKGHFSRPSVQSHLQIDPFLWCRDRLQVFSKTPCLPGGLAASAARVQPGEAARDSETSISDSHLHPCVCSASAGLGRRGLFPPRVFVRACACLWCVRACVRARVSESCMLHDSMLHCFTAS